MFKIFKRFEDVDSDLFLRRSESGLRSHKFKLVKLRVIKRPDTDTGVTTHQTVGRFLMYGVRIM